MTRKCFQSQNAHYLYIENGSQFCILMSLFNIIQLTHSFSQTHSLNVKFQNNTRIITRKKNNYFFENQLIDGIFHILLGLKYLNNVLGTGQLFYKPKVIFDKQTRNGLELT